ncbi:sensor histidine kinase [Bradyrhizobium japonicum]|uniref:sensor histidine kinase n=2 Tax=Bradyrhizobium japonicum TaxID=375 RepID=UPI00068EE5A5|nr:MEDS domain-containing protein [Bradyrhizobium japonicum]MCD9112336.1 MEDS domain-containing protein [Bradyrhizobium japonicum]MCD9258333.1 MEDS domain-containing protein [Bradyrhizobium japonicum SEMIA 5079]MCD9824097.1 MEDS domain-containing protein [Bradyrhizobium japonicum]MCD9896754.1 MEDS domain-containing protein [Bradyrhizobium japonicum]MCD9912363.1 MEDS domain-containing protein [Bradyrhizobium japonicum]
MSGEAFGKCACRITPRSTGIDELPWGSHLCQFFANGDELRDAIVPYFKAGLENDERCLLVAMAPFGADDAHSALRAAVGDFDRRELEKQIEIHDVRTWYAAAGAIDSERMADGLLRSEEQARDGGYNGFRTNGNIGWLRRDQWTDFQGYEARVSRGLKGRRMISLCSYCLDGCGPPDVLDVACRHDVTLGRNGGGWTAMAAGGDELARRSATEQRLSLLAQELEHRIKNSLATVQALAGSTIRNAHSLEEFEKSFNGRIGALSRTHSMLTAGGQEHVALRELLENELAMYSDESRDRVSMAGPDVVLGAQPAMAFGMALHELTTNAIKHGALSPRGGKLEVVWNRVANGLAFVWIEKDVYLSSQPARMSFGTQLLRRLLPHQLGARVDMNFNPDGLRANIEIPLA